MVVRLAHHHPEPAADEQRAWQGMDITLKDYQKKVQLNSSQILTVTKAILRHERVHQATLSIVFVSHQKIRAFNNKYLKRNHGTDVLAFDLNDHRVVPKRKPKTLTGDIIISTDAALKNVNAFQTTLSCELVLYITHGILHLLGYDDHKPSDVVKMRLKEQEILSHLGKKIKPIARRKRIREIKLSQVTLADQM